MAAGGTWTNAYWRVAIGVSWTMTLTAANPSVRIKYRRYGVAIPPYWSGSFTGSKTFTFYPWDIYARVDVKPDSTVSITVSDSIGTATKTV